MSEMFSTKNPDESPLDADGFIGVDPIYQNWANKTDAPLGEDEPSEPEEVTEDEEPKSDPETPKVPKAAKPA